MLLSGLLAIVGLTLAGGIQPNIIIVTVDDVVSISYVCKCISVSVTQSYYFI